MRTHLKTHEKKKDTIVATVIDSAPVNAAHIVSDLTALQQVTCLPIRYYSWLNIDFMHCIAHLCSMWRTGPSRPSIFQLPDTHSPADEGQGPLVFACSMCASTFASKRALTRHEQRHDAITIIEQQPPPVAVYMVPMSQPEPRGQAEESMDQCK